MITNAALELRTQFKRVEKLEKQIEQCRQTLDLHQQAINGEVKSFSEKLLEIEKYLKMAKEFMVAGKINMFKIQLSSIEDNYSKLNEELRNRLSKLNIVILDEQQFTKAYFAREKIVFKKLRTQKSISQKSRKLLRASSVKKSASKEKEPELTKSEKVLQKSIQRLTKKYKTLSSATHKIDQGIQHYTFSQSIHFTSQKPARQKTQESNGVGCKVEEHKKDGAGATSSSKP